MAADCAEEKLNIGKSRCTKAPKLAQYMIWTPNDFVIEEADLADAATFKAFIQAALKAAVDVRIYLFPAFSRVEPQSEDAVYIQSPLGSRKVREGNYRDRYFIDESLCTHKAMFTHTTKEGRVIIIDVEGQWTLVEDSDGNYRGQSLDLLSVEKIIRSTGDNLTETPVYVSLSDSNELNRNGFLYSFPGLVSELEPLTDVTLTIVVEDTDNLKVTVTNTCDGTLVSGLVVGDFTVLTAAGAAQAPDSRTVVSAGVYRLTRAANFVTGTVNLVSAATLSIEAYEATATAFVGA